MGKSFHHKKQNRFRYQSFSERIGRISIDVVHRIRDRDCELQESSTYFKEALDKWTELNCTEHFASFTNEVSDKVQTFNQLVYHEEDIVSTLKKHLLVPGSLAFEPLLDLVVQLARDLQNDFYKHFRDMFNILVKLLNNHPQDTDLLEQTFSCLSYLFKFLWRYLLKDIKDVFRYYSPLLGHKYKEYIRNFAAESFAFLMRKIKDHGDLFDFMFLSLVDHPDQTSGVGKLMFEMMKGVQHHFHSCAKKVFPILLTKLGPYQGVQSVKQLPWELVRGSLSQTMTSMAQHADSNTIECLWPVLLKSLVDFHCALVEERDFENRREMMQQFEHYMSLMSIWLIYKNGELVSHPDGVAEALIAILHNPTELDADAADALLTVVSDFLLICHQRLSYLDTAKIIHEVFKSDYSEKCIFDFVKTLFDWPAFEKDFLPLLLSHVQKSQQQHWRSAMKLLTELIIHKVPLPLVASEQHGYQGYMLDFGASISKSASNSTFPQYVLSLIEKCSPEELADDEYLVSLWEALVCVCQVKPLRDSQLCPALLKVIDMLWQSSLKSDVLAVSGKPESLSTNQQFFVLWQALVSLKHTQESSEFWKVTSLDKITSLLRMHSRSVHALQVADLFFCEAALEKSDVLTEDVALTVYSLLKLNLSSVSAQVRLLTVHILSQFQSPFPTLENWNPNLFQIFLEAEHCPLTVNDYRQRLLYLQRLDYNLVKTHLPQGPYEQCPLLFLIGNLSCNFKLLWEPVMKVIATYALGMDSQRFWEVYSDQLRRAAAAAEEELASQNQVRKHENAASDSSLDELFSSQMSQVKDVSKKADFTNFRYQLWKAMLHFTEKCEAQSRDISQLFLQFLKNEYWLSDHSVAPTQNILRNRMEEDEEDAADESLAEAEGENNALEVESKSKKLSQATSRSLMVHLELFSNFRNPKSLHLEARLKELYYEFLLYRDPAIQKLAFDCLMTYKFKEIVLYRENFLRILDDKTFKNELVLFSLDSDSGIISLEHRAQVFLILMRILHGKMYSKSSSSHAGRKSLIFQFLCGCQEDELLLFMDMVFSHFKQFQSAASHEKVLEILNGTDFRKIIPLKKMQGVLYTIDTVCKKLGQKLNAYLTSLLQIITGILATCVSCLNHRDQISAKVVGQLKHLRQTCFQRLIQFFQDFDKYSFTPDDIDAVFEVAVWPQLNKLVHEGIHHPTPLLKLLSVWTSFPRYFWCLAKHHKEDRSLTPLKSMFELLCCREVDRKVTAFIMDMVNNLLLGPEDEDTLVDTVQVNDVVDLGDTEGKDLGVCLLLPHISRIFAYLQNNLKDVMQNINKKQENCIEMKILSRISAYVNDQKQGMTLALILLPSLTNSGSRNTEMEQDILQSIYNLLTSVAAPEKFFFSVAKLFSSVHNQKSRELVCKIFGTMAEKDRSLKSVSEIIVQLNSWNKNRMEEPDYNSRLLGYQMANQAIRDMEKLDVRYLVALLHNFCYFIFMVDNFSLRDNATNCLVTIVKQFQKHECFKNAFLKVILENLVPHVKAGLKSKVENIRHEFVVVLAALARVFSSQVQFAGLAPLADDEPEADFFENIRHIQMHRRARALKKMAVYLRGNKIRMETIVSYMLPQVAVFISESCYCSIQGLQAAAVETLGEICRQLSWPLYLHQLKYYLYRVPRTMHNQKLIVKVLVTILDAFHFDLSQSSFDITRTPNLVRTSHQIEETEENMQVSNKESPDTIVEVGEIRKTVCSPKLATMIHTSISKNILPRLYKTLTQKVRSDTQHKLVRSAFAEDEEILRVPVALAMVKLLQNLPKASLDNNLPGILLRICQFLKSRASGIRNTSQVTLLKILRTLGPLYFPYILAELRSVLRRGYQLHVLGYTVHMLLKALSPELKCGELVVCLKSLLEIFHEDVFGYVAEEKTVKAIVVKLKEAKTCKTYDSYGIVCKHINKESLSMVIASLKGVLDGTHSHKTAQKVEKILKKVLLGLLANTSISVKELLIFIHSIITDTLPILLKSEKRNTKNTVETDSRLAPPNCLLLPEKPERGSDLVKTNKKTNIHILAEFGLMFLHICLKRKKLLPNDREHIQMLDPFVSILSDCLSSKYVKMITYALRCLVHILKFPLPSLKSCISDVAGRLFVLLKNYVSAGAAKGENQELVTMCFKVVTVVVKHVKFHQIDSDQLFVLVTFCEEDIEDYTRRGMAFSLIKAIMSRKLVSPQLEELVTKIEKMAVSSDLPHVQRQCREVFLHFLLNYPIGKKVETHLEFFVGQLSYIYEDGYMSVLEMLVSIFNTFPETLLKKYSELFFFPLSGALVNSRSLKCCKLTAMAIEALLKKLDDNTRNRLFSIVMQWFKDTKLSLQTTAAHVCQRFVVVESGKFMSRVSAVLMLIQEQIDPEKYNVGNAAGSKDLDHLLYSYLHTLLKILQQCPIVRNQKWTLQMNVVWGYVQSLLHHPHSSVQRVATQLFGILLAAWTAEELADSVMVEGKEVNDQHLEFLEINGQSKVHSLVLDFRTVFQSKFLDSELAEQLVKNLVFLTKVIRCIIEREEQLEGTREVTDKQAKLSLPWIVRKMIWEANYESIHTSKVTLRRSYIFKWIAAISLDLGEKFLPSVLKIMMPPLQREMNDTINTQDPKLKVLAQEVVELLKKTVDINVFSQVYAAVQSFRIQKKESRKRKKTMDVIANPEVAAKRKLKKNILNKEAKRRKVRGIKFLRKTESTGPQRTAKKRKGEEIRSLRKEKRKKLK